MSFQVILFEWCRISVSCIVLQSLRRKLSKSIIILQTPTGGMANEKTQETRYKLSEEELLDEIRRLADELGHIPTSTEMEQQGNHSYTTYANRFGTWKEAITQSGLDPNKLPSAGRSTTPISDEELIESLKNLEKEVGKPPSITDVRQVGDYSPDTYKKRFGTWKDVLSKAGIDRDAWLDERSQKQRKKIISELQLLAEKLGRSPSPADVDEYGDISTSGVTMEMGTWEKALKEAGLETTYTPVPQTSDDEEYLAELRRVADTLGRTPTTKEMSQKGEVSANVYRRRFGTWNAGVRAAGLEPHVKNRITKEEYIDEINRLSNELGRPPTSTDMKKHGEYSVVTGNKLFGEWRDVIATAGFDESEIDTLGSGRKTISESELIDDLQSVEDEVGHHPTTAEVGEHGSYSYATYVSRFGSWNDALKAAGMDVGDTPPRAEISKEDLITEIQRLGEQLGRPPKTKEMNSNGKYRASTYRSRFGSWREALNESGYDEDTIRNTIAGRIPESALIEELQRVAEELGRTPSTNDINHHGKYSISPYQNRFGSWSNAIKAAGLEN